MPVPLSVRVLIVSSPLLAAGFLLLLFVMVALTPAQTEAQAPQPALYRVADYQTGNYPTSVYWFETADSECYLAVRGDARAGPGIACLRKTAP